MTEKRQKLIEFFENVCMKRCGQYCTTLEKCLSYSMNVGSWKNKIYPNGYDGPFRKRLVPPSNPFDPFQHSKFVTEDFVVSKSSCPCFRDRKDYDIERDSKMLKESEESAKKIISDYDVIREANLKMRNTEKQEKEENNIKKRIKKGKK